jgi:hypothetical protein
LTLHISSFSFPLHLNAKVTKNQLPSTHTADRRAPVDEMSGRKISFNTVRRMAVALPGVEEGTIHGSPAFKLRGRFLACVAIHKSAEAGSLAVRIPRDLRAELMESKPETYYLTDHYVNYPTVLVRLSRIDINGLRELLEASWRFVSGKQTKAIE